MASHHTCSECKYIKCTSDGQVFLRCDFWCDLELRDAWAYVPDEWHGSIQSYIVLHCHMQPESPACLAFRPRRADDAATDTGELLCAG